MVQIVDPTTHKIVISRDVFSNEDLLCNEKVEPKLVKNTLEVGSRGRANVSADS